MFVSTRHCDRNVRTVMSCKRWTDTMLQVGHKSCLLFLASFGVVAIDQANIDRNEED